MALTLTLSPTDDDIYQGKLVTNMAMIRINGAAAHDRVVTLAIFENGTYKVVADSAGLNPEQLREQKETINSIKRRYAYNMVIQELNKQGYQVVEEKKMEKDTVKLVARKWQ